MMKQRKKKNSKTRFRFGYGIFIGFFVIVAMGAMMINVMIVQEHAKQRQKSSKQQQPLSISSSSKEEFVVSLEKRQQQQQHLQKQQPRQKEEPEKEIISAGGTAKKKLQEHQPPDKKQVNNKEGRNNIVAKNDSKNSNNNDKHSTIHVVFSTSCHVKQDWQSYVFFFQAMVHNQQGTVTRVVSGCTKEQELQMIDVFEKQILIMSTNFKIHFTPEYGKVPGKNYQSTKYWNKPFSLRHWLESDIFGYNFEQNILTSSKDDDVIVLVDPDMLIQRPFVNNFPQYVDDLWISPIRNSGNIYTKVSHGKPMAQDYSFGSAWLSSSQSNLTHVVGTNSPVHTVSDYDARVYYSAGPPYIATAKDMYQISYYWTKFLPKIFDLFPKFMAEMYGYCMAAAHLQLKHQLAQGFMVSNIFMRNQEGWSFLKDVTDDACDVEKFKDVVPQVIHFCQRYSIGEFFLSKYKLPVEILSCDFPLLKLPPKDIAAYTNYSHYGDMSIKVWGKSERNMITRNAYMICSLMPALNKAATFFKDHNCPNGAKYDQTWNTFK